MNAIDIAVIIIVSLAFVSAVGYLIYRKIKRKGSGCCDCGGSCGSCDGCSHCNAKDKSEE